MTGTKKPVFALLATFVVLFGVVESANGQFRQSRALQFGVKVGASSYTGDVGPAPPGTPAFDATYEFEGFYRFNRWLNFGLKHSTGAYPALGGASDRRHSTAIGLRSYVLGGRFSPYLQVGVSRSYGGERTGFGLSSALGVEIAVSRRFAIFQDVSFDSVSPDDALDGSIGGRSYDLVGRIGVGIRVTLGKQPSLLGIERIDHPESIQAGESVRLEAVLANAKDDVQVEWELPGGVIYRSNPVDHVFAAPGRYEFDVVAKSGSGRVSERVRIDVQPSAESVAEALIDSTIGTAAIETIYGPRVTVAGTESVYRVRLENGAEQPVEYRWSMGDGVHLEGNNVAYRFERPGTYAITARVRNSVSADSLTIAVLVDPEPSDQPVVAADIKGSSDAPVEQPAANEAVNPDERGAQKGSVGVDTKSVDASASSETASIDVATAIANKIAASSGDATTEPAAGAEAVQDGGDQTNPQREVVLQAPPVPGIDWTVGGFTWVVESAASREAAEKLVPNYKSLGFPVGVFRDAYNGKVEYHVVVGQSASKTVAERIGVRIQRHVPRRIWLLEIPS